MPDPDPASPLPEDPAFRDPRLDQPLYRMREGRFHASSSAGSPWRESGQHGGPPCGLLARTALRRLSEEVEDVEAFQPARFTADLYRAVPMAPLEARAQVMRLGRRLVVVEATLWADHPVDGERSVARASVLFLRRSAASDADSGLPAVPAGPDGFETGGMMPRTLRDRVPPGFHFEVDVCWVESSRTPVAWIRMVNPLVEGEATSPFERVAALSDFTNALASRGRFKTTGEQQGFINCDSSFHLTRLPVGEWLAFDCDRTADQAGVGVSEATIYDSEGVVGRSVQARLANADPPGLRSSGS